MKVVSTYDEYLKACKEVCDTSVYAWMPKVSYVIDTLTDLNDLLDKVDHKTLKGIIKEIIDNYGKEFYYGKLVGVELTNEDYYYIYERFDKRVYDSCVGGLRK
jgi:hypothetical protein